MPCAGCTNNYPEYSYLIIHNFHQKAKGETQIRHYFLFLLRIISVLCYFWLFLQKVYNFRPVKRPKTNYQT